MTENYSICILGKFHNVLYIAAKLCYDWQIDNNELVTKILNDIFYCEKSFERIIIGAIFGTRVTHFLSGWKSDFENKEENIKALVYFLDHAVQARLEFYCLALSSTRRFVIVHKILIY
jgi:ankyrin repeat/SOCS box protein 17